MAGREPGRPLLPSNLGIEPAPEEPIRFRPGDDSGSRACLDPELTPEDGRAGRLAVQGLAGQQAEVFAPSRSRSGPGAPPRDGPGNCSAPKLYREVLNPDSSAPRLQPGSARPARAGPAGADGIGPGAGAQLRPGPTKQKRPASCCHSNLVREVPAPRPAPAPRRSRRRSMPELTCNWRPGSPKQNLRSWKDRMTAAALPGAAARSLFPAAGAAGQNREVQGAGQCARFRRRGAPYWTYHDVQCQSAGTRGSRPAPRRLPECSFIDDARGWPRLRPPRSEGLLAPATEARRSNSNRRQVMDQREGDESIRGWGGRLVDVCTGGRLWPGARWGWGTRARASLNRSSDDAGPVANWRRLRSLLQLGYGAANGALAGRDRGCPRAAGEGNRADHHAPS